MGIKKVFQEMRIINSDFLNDLDISIAKKIIEIIENKKIGIKNIIQIERLGVSRQRYWGCPINDIS